MDGHFCPKTAVAKPLRVDETSIGHIQGIVKVVQEGSFVGVVAETEWAAIQAAKALKVSWSKPETKMPANRAEVDKYLTEVTPIRDITPTKRGNVDNAFSQAVKTMEATYHWPFQLHGRRFPPVLLRMSKGIRSAFGPGRKGR